MRDTHRTFCLSTGTAILQVVRCDLELSQLDGEEGLHTNVLRGRDEIQRLRFRSVAARDSESAGTYGRTAIMGDNAL
jgi:hypothetical protein